MKGFSIVDHLNISTSGCRPGLFFCLCQLSYRECRHADKEVFIRPWISLKNSWILLKTIEYHCWLPGDWIAVVTIGFRLRLSVLLMRRGCVKLHAFEAQRDNWNMSAAKFMDHKSSKDSDLGARYYYPKSRLNSPVGATHTLSSLAQLARITGVWNWRNLYFTVRADEIIRKFLTGYSV